MFDDDQSYNQEINKNLRAARLGIKSLLPT